MCVVQVSFYDLKKKRRNDARNAFDFYHKNVPTEAINKL